MATLVEIRNRIAKTYVDNPKLFTLEQLQKAWLDELVENFGPGIAQKGMQLYYVSIHAAREYLRVLRMDPARLPNMFYEIVLASDGLVAA